MPLIRSSHAPAFDVPGLQVIGLAAPSRGATETCVWRITVAPGTPGTTHSVDREEIFVGLSGEARAELGGNSTTLTPGDTLVVPAGESFALGNPGVEPFTALVVLPVGAKAAMPGGEPFAPPWTQ
jgi:mannose-6-phosphate isomerase-like protein (cupin superfamily)